MGGFAIFAGCAATGTGATKPSPVTVVAIKEMIATGVSPDTILQKMRDSGTVYRLSAAELARLHDDGVADEIINYMQDTYLNAVRQNQALADQRYWFLESDGYWYGGWPYGWPEPWWAFGRFRPPSPHPKENDDHSDKHHSQIHPKDWINWLDIG